MKFGGTVRVETLQYSTKTTARKKADRGVRYDYYLQLVASKRIERVPNLQPAKGGQSWSCKWLYRRYPRRKFSGGAAPLLGLCGDGCGLLAHALAA